MRPRDATCAIRVCVQNESLVVYLNDHIAGSVAALELLEHLRDAYEGQPLERFFADLHREIKADQDVLRNLLGRFEEKESALRKTAAWVTEKFAHWKVKFAGEQVGGLGLVQALEMLVLGIRGKQLLWRALAQADKTVTRDVDLAQLEDRAIVQQKRVEEKRLAAAREAFASAADAAGQPSK